LIPHHSFAPFWRGLLDILKENDLANIVVSGALALLAAAPCLAQESAFVVGDDLPPPLSVSRKVIAMIFDDGPLPGTTPALLDALKQNAMKATFSVIGKNVEANPDLARRIVAEGHEIANQTWSHPDMAALSPEQILEEVNRADEVIFKVTGVHPKYFRPPDGKMPFSTGDLIMAQGYKILMPTFDSGDWRSPPPGVVRKTILGGVTPGAIVLAHDSFPKSVAEMPGIFKELSNRGFTSCTVSELVAQALLRD
jgi:peptidoglycan/xylan/chitin deacetylase (PgdA/CDA1 family)